MDTLACGQSLAIAPPPVREAVHSDIVNDVVRGDGETEIISSSEDGSCVLYDWRRGQVVRQLQLTFQPSRCVAYR